LEEIKEANEEDEEEKAAQKMTSDDHEYIQKELRIINEYIRQTKFNLEK
jgi:hypothetical protein